MQKQFHHGVFTAKTDKMGLTSLDTEKVTFGDCVKSAVCFRVEHGRTRTQTRTNGADALTGRQRLFRLILRAFEADFGRGVRLWFFPVRFPVQFVSGFACPALSADRAGASGAADGVKRARLICFGGIGGAKTLCGFSVGVELKKRVRGVRVRTPRTHFFQSSL